MKMRGKKAVSPVIATVLLIALVIILALLVYAWWSKWFITEKVQKEGMPADQACGEIDLRVQYFASSSEVQVTNVGDIAVYKIEVRKTTGGSTTKEEYDGVQPGGSTTQNIGSADEVKVVPVILGTSDGAQKAYVCKQEFSA